MKKKVRLINNMPRFIHSFMKEGCRRGWYCLLSQRGAGLVHLCALLVATSLFAGCAKLTHLEELLTLKDLSENQDGQAREMDRQTANFQRVKAAYEANELTRYPTSKSFQSEFGLPVVKSSVTRQGESQERWVYCVPTDVLKGERVVVYFSARGEQVGAEWVPAQVSSP